ncbi:MAG: hypothetical protein PF503_03055 [Desulfobacula sp.]|jgi:1-aminocyclopropane-1-carboxylate deaminase/D-cysteine desulfhydrase-like pyridoxal-dependent ACC family enzyme|nr:hypothetical protein [Desulfobacula sp.]
MKLDTLPRFHLAEFPTPIQYLDVLTKKYKGPAIYMKRDDLTSLGMGGFIDLIQKGYFTKDQTVLFWHTGGTPELFAWADQCSKKI